MSDGAQWYVVHTYSGYENTVKATIEKYVENRGLQDLIHEISIPLETVTEITDNGPKEVERKVFPGYVLVKMVMTDECWHIVRNIRGVTGFLGSGNKPIPLSESDIALIGSALGQLARLRHHGGGLVVIHEHVRHEEGRRLTGKVHVLDDAEQLHVVVT